MTKSTWGETDVPDQSGRVAVVTGANSGLGYDTARVLAEHGATVVLAVRDTDKGAQAAQRIGTGDVRVQQLDLGSLDSVRAAAAQLGADHPRIDLLVDNAGVMFPPRQQTSDGFELQFGTNHLGHFAFTGLLLEHLLPVPGSRVVAVSSIAHKPGRIRFDDLQWQRRYSRFAAYAQSKLANLMFAFTLQRKLAAAGADTVAVAAHPGYTRSELVRYLPKAIQLGAKLLPPGIGQTPEMGALPQLRAATDPDVRGGQYWGPDGFREFGGRPVLVQGTGRSRNTELQDRLWAESEQLTGVSYPL